jgi:hypothetical protein
MQMPTASPTNPLMNVQNDVRRGLNEIDRNPVAAGNANKQAVAGMSVPQPQSTTQSASAQISRGYLDIKI